MHGSTSGLQGIEIGLVLPLAALLEEESVVRAAKRVGLSASATSHALARLRDLLGDELLVRAGRRLVRTPRGTELLEPARRAVSELETVFRPPASLEPKRLRAAFRIATTDHVQLVLLRDVDRALAREAPDVDVYSVPMDRGSYVSLREGGADVAIGVFDHPPPDFGRAALWGDSLVTVVRARHPLTRARVTEKRFVAFPHVLVAPLGTPHGLVDDVLAKRGLARRVARTLPTFVDAAHFVAESDYVVALPASLVDRIKKTLRLRAIDVPVPMPRFTIAMTWHKRLESDPAQAWFRALVTRTAHLG